MRCTIISSILALLLVAACGRHDDGPADKTILEQAKPYYDEACASYQPSQTPRCDRATFVASQTTLCGDHYGLAQYEITPGQWMRDTTECYPDESKSQCSRDTYLWVMFDAYKRGDFARLQRIKDYGEAHDWVMCVGDDDRVSIKPLVSLLNKILDGQNLVGEADAMPDDLDVVTKALAGFRGHLVAGYLWFRGDVLHGLTTNVTLRLIKEETPASPWFSSLFHRFDSKDTDQGGTLELLKVADGDYGWGSSPPQFHKAATYKVLEGF